MTNDNNPLTAKSVGARLELIRVAMDVSNETIAEMISVSPQRWSNWRFGLSVIPLECAARLCTISGATTDFIYHDVRGAISMALVVKLIRVRSEANKKRQERPHKRFSKL